MLPVLIVSLAAAILTGAAIFARRVASGGFILEIGFGISVAVFLGCLLTLLVRKAALTLRNGEDEEPPKEPSKDQDRATGG